ncbi:MAG: helix-hairpin-helix domain-containing protein [Actinomycetota bacterium]|nr:helix-hairpin-helix domain-containing protein [Actinomycetota bacterium]
MNDIVVERGFSARLEALVGRRIDTSILIAFVAVLVLGGLFVWSRKPAAAIAPPATAAPLVATTPGPATAELLVHVAGAVKQPGLYAFPPGARVADAVEAAGGPAPRAGLDLLNLAEPLVDGVKVDVPLRGEGPAPAAPAAVAGGSAAPVSLNSADQATLETVPGIGPVTAAAILAYREEAGTFGAIEQLLEVSGIGPATLEEIRPYVTL